MNIKPVFKKFYITFKKIPIKSNPRFEEITQIEDTSIQKKSEIQSFLTDFQNKIALIDSYISKYFKGYF